MKNQAEKILKENGFKVTQDRTALLSVLIHSKKPLSVEDIEKKLGKDTSMTTVYRILDKLVEKGLVYKAHFGKGKAFFEYQKNHHHHITCSKCGLQKKVSFCIDVENLIPTKSVKQFSSIDNHILEFFGTCKKCA